VFLCYPDRRQVLPKLRAFIEHVKYRSAEGRREGAATRRARKPLSATMPRTRDDGGKG
jgi:hypothetical protein